MDRRFVHELAYRGTDTLTRLAVLKITICGAGALGANITFNLARHGCLNLTVIDRDRVEIHNLPTQPYGLRDLGAQKASILAARMFRDLGTSVKVNAVELSGTNVHKLLSGCNLVVDTFDNAGSRRIVTEFCKTAGLHCLHAGMSNDGYSEVVWNEQYHVPADTDGTDPCDYPLAKNLVDITVSLASETIIGFIATGKKQNFCFTLGDKVIHTN